MATIDEYRLKVCGILERYGIDPSTTLQDGMSDEGYESILMDGTGEPILRQDEILRELKPWPEGCWDEIQEVYRD